MLRTAMADVHGREMVRRQKGVERSSNRTRNQEARWKASIVAATSPT